VTLLSPAALDFLWESLDAGELPYPLDVPSHGETMDERAALRSRVLASRSPEVEALLALLARGTESVDSVFENTASLAVGDGTRAVLATQSPDGVQLTPVDPGALVSSVVAQLPPAPRGTEKSITIPAADLASLARGGPAGGTSRDRQVLAALSAQPKLRGGQLAVNARTPVGGRRRSPVLSWFDTGSGRYLTYSSTGRDGTEWVTIAPADPPALRHRLSEMLVAVRAHPR
jgi:hypothetical protein